MKQKLKTPEELGLTPEQFKNLCILTTFVRKRVPPPKFDIGSWHRNPAGREVQPNERDYSCGSSACFLGYGPLAGIEPKEGEHWMQYSKRSFNAAELSASYGFLFETGHENCPTAACRRAAWFLINGLPEGTWQGLSSWETPTYFRAPWKLIEQHANA